MQLMKDPQEKDLGVRSDRKTKKFPMEDHTTDIELYQSGHGKKGETS